MTTQITPNTSARINVTENRKRLNHLWLWKSNNKWLYQKCSKLIFQPDLGTGLLVMGCFMNLYITKQDSNKLFFFHFPSFRARMISVAIDTSRQRLGPRIQAHAYVDLFKWTLFFNKMGSFGLNSNMAPKIFLVLPTWKWRRLLLMFYANQTWMVIFEYSISKQH